MRKLVCLMVMVGGVVANANAQSGDLDVRNLKVVPEGNGISAVTGTATNRSDHTLANAFVELKLYDSQGTVVGNLVDHVSNLSPGERWDFKAETATRFSTVRLTDVKLFPAPQ